MELFLFLFFVLFVGGEGVFQNDKGKNDQTKNFYSAIRNCFYHKIKQKIKHFVKASLRKYVCLFVVVVDVHSLEAIGIRIKNIHHLGRSSESILISPFIRLY